MTEVIPTTFQTGGAGTIISAIFGLLTLIVTSVMTYLMAKLNKKSTEAAVKVEEAAVKVEEVRLKATVTAKKVEDVKTTLDASTTATQNQLTDISVDVKETKEYCNSALGRALRLAAVATRALAEAPNASPAAIAAAAEADKEWKDHEDKQEKIDLMRLKGRGEPQGGKS